MKLRIPFFVFITILVAILAFLAINIVSFLRCFSIAEELPELEYQVMRVKFYGSSDVDGENTVSANFSILDPQGNEIAVIERSWNGSYLFLVFRTAEFSGKTFYFPEKIYSSETTELKLGAPFSAKGTRLYPYYMENGECFLLGNKSTLAQRNKMFFLAKFAFSPFALLSGNFSKHTVNLSDLETGEPRGISCSSKGWIY